MPGDPLTFTLLSFSSLFIVVNPLGATLTYVSLTEGMEAPTKLRVAREACRSAFAILIAFCFLGGPLLSLFGITVDAFRIAGGILLFGIGMEMVYARPSRTKLTATEKYESRGDADDIALMPIALPMIAGPGAITTTIVLMNEAAWAPDRVAIIVASIAVSVLATYVAMAESDAMVRRIGQREYRAVNRLMGMLLLAIAVQFVINGLRSAFPVLAAGAL